VAADPLPGALDAKVDVVVVTDDAAEGHVMLSTSLSSMTLFVFLSASTGA